MNESLTRLVRERAQHHCEYCGLHENDSVVPFEIDHIIARKHGGATSSDNLALSCFYCNSAKGPNIAGIDPETGEIVRLFHPRQDRWPDHFQNVANMMVGVTAIGRATIQVLQLNQTELVILRDLIQAR